MTAANNAFGAQVMTFLNRVEAGRLLAEYVRRYGVSGDNTVVLGLPRGGIPVAYEVAIALGAPLDVIVVRKLGVPFQPELAMGAIGESGARTINDDVISMTGVTEEELASVERRERVELQRRAERFRAARPRVPLSGRTALVVDDGIATGSTARAACQVARAQGAARVVLAVPVAPPSSLRELRMDTDDVICVHEAEPLWAVGQFYVDFTQTTDEEVIRLLADAARRQTPDPGEPMQGEEVDIPVHPVQLNGSLAIPEQARGIVVFAHGSGSSRLSPRNRFVAEELNRAGLGTLLFDLLTTSEERDRGNVFDIPLLGDRLSAATEWLRRQPGVAGLPIGFFGASTGAAAALWAAAEPDARIGAIVSRGGRPDLAGERLGLVTAPTLLIVGGRDPVVEQLNKEAQEELHCESLLEIVPGATHLFEETGALEQVAALACEWFLTHLRPTRTSPGVRGQVPGWDPSLESAREGAEGTELFEDPLRHRSNQAEREEAQGVELFTDPDEGMPLDALAEGSPGHETLTGDQAGMGTNEENERAREDR